MHVIGVGEILWDLIGASEYLGGAVLNFSVQTARLGHRVSLVSAVGDDRRGRLAIRQARALGLSVEDNSEIGGPFVGVGALTYRQPVYPGDTITARSTTKAARLSASNPANGIVTWLTEGFNQRDELVIDFERSNLVRLRHPPEKEVAA